MKVSQMQSMLALNAAQITSIGNTVGERWRYYRGIAVWGGEIYRKRHIHNTEKLASQIKRLSAIQRSLKDDIKAARTSKRVYKKHGKILDADGAILSADRALLYSHQMVARQANYGKEYL